MRWAPLPVSETATCCETGRLWQDNAPPGEHRGGLSPKLVGIEEGSRLIFPCPAYWCSGTPDEIRDGLPWSGCCRPLHGRPRIAAAVRIGRACAVCRIRQREAEIYRLRHRHTPGVWQARAARAGHASQRWFGAAIADAIRSRRAPAWLGASSASVGCRS